MKVKVIRPCGYRYLIELLPNEEVEKTSKSGIVIPEHTKYAQELQGHKRSICVGKILQKGISTKIESDRKTQWANVNDYVLINKYSGFELPNESGLIQMIVNDEDILSIVEVIE